MQKCLIQGYEGSFHEMAMHQFFGYGKMTAVPCDSFDVLANKLSSGEADVAIMAIENSIAGSILQNYRILREHGFKILGEQYLRIQHQLMCLPGTGLEDIREVLSHPMALNQCLHFLNDHAGWERTEFSDTALAAKKVKGKNLGNTAAIASRLAADIYGLEIVAEDIETDESNYTRFFIIGNQVGEYRGKVDKSSIYIRVKHEQGSLLKALMAINNADINMSKLQSFPVVGSRSEYYFYIDLEFNDKDVYDLCIEELKRQCLACDVLGEYKNAMGVREMVSSFSKASLK